VTAIIEVRSASFRLALHAQHILANSVISRQLRVTGYNFPFHIHILCILYGTVLANTAVLYTYHLFASTWRSLVSVITTLYYVVIIFRHRVWYRSLSLRYACLFKVRASSSSPRLPLYQISFLLQPPLLS